MKLLSYNVGLVNPEAVFINVDGLIDDLLSVDADVVALHEFERELCPKLDEAMLASYPYVHYLKRADKGYSCALFCRWQMEDACEMSLPFGKDVDFLRSIALTDGDKAEAENRGVLGVTIVTPDCNRLRVITCHLMSNGFNQLLIHEGISPFKRFPLFWKRYKMSCEGRNTETRYIGKCVSQAVGQKLPVIVCGDTNSFWWSKAIKTICGSDLRDAFLSVASCTAIELLKKWLSTFGFGHTLYAHHIMYFRLDYVLHSKSIKVNSYKVPHWKYSDHYPVVVEMDIITRY